MRNHYDAYHRTRHLRIKLVMAYANVSQMKGLNILIHTNVVNQME